jgi:hypothetical protein
VVHGASGAGKTYLMAKVAVVVCGQGRGPLLARFLGTTPCSSNVIGLVSSVSQQIRRMASMSGQVIASCPSGFEDVCRYLREALERCCWGPTIIILDSLDQLDDSNGGRKLAWLPVRNLDLRVHMVVSSLPDEPNPEVGRPFACLSLLRRRIRDEEAFVEVTPLTSSAQLLLHLLRLRGRDATPAQLSLIEVAMSKADCKVHTPLVVTILANCVSEWRSYDDVGEVYVESVRGIVVGMVQRLEGKHGRKLVVHLLSFLTLAVEGISETELQECLSLADDVLAEAVTW